MTKHLRNLALAIMSSLAAPLLAAEPVTLTAFGDAAGIRGFGIHGEQNRDWVASGLKGVERLRSDINFLNLEASLTRRCRRYMKKSYQFSMGPKTLQQFAKWGFNLFGLANNHTIDCLSPFPANESVAVQSSLQRQYPRARFHGIAKTLARLQKPAVVKVRGLRVGMVSMKAWANPRAWPLASLGNKDLVLQALADADVDVRVLSLHGGEENARTPTPLMRNIAREFLAKYNGDVVLGHHSHTMQGYEVVRKSNGRVGAIFYSLGNFLHNGLSKRGDGKAVRLAFTKVGLTGVQIVPLAGASHAPSMTSGSGLEKLQRILRTNHRHLSRHPLPSGLTKLKASERSVRRPFPHIEVRPPAPMLSRKSGIPGSFRLPAVQGRVPIP